MNDERSPKIDGIIGLSYRKEQDELVRKQLDGKITEEEFLKEVQNRLKRRSENE